MRLPLDPIDCLLALDPTARGIASFFAPGGARSAARSLARGHRIVIATGFDGGPGFRKPAPHPALQSSAGLSASRGGR